jgi:succinate dehydrogenase/fumarate reductase flavoprotein subunit
MKKEVVEADLLCVGGGIAGLMAAIRAAEFGAKVIVAEKGNTKSSGAGRVGNDHFQCYIPEIHGSDIRPLIKELQYSFKFAMRDASFVQTWLEKSFDIVKLWDSWGIPMKYKGKWEFAGHGYPGSRLKHLKYAGHNQKAVLTQEARNRGAEIMDRVMVFDLLGDNGVIGAIGIDTRADRVIVFQTKAVILATGFCMRLYPSPTPAWMCNLTFPPTLTGDGRAMAYRIGAEIVNMEIPYRHSGPKYFVRSGQASWVGVLRDPQGKPVGPFVTEPNKKYGDAAAQHYPTLFEDYAKSGRGPIYMDCSGISGEDYEYMMYWLRHEGYESFLHYLEEESIDLRKNPVEFTSYEMRLTGGIYYNEKAETSVRGLYAAGDELFGGISGAAVFGFIAGENAAQYAKNVKSAQIETVEAKINEDIRLFDDIRNREVGPEWKEVNITLQQIMDDYAGSIRSETLLKAGLTYLQRLKEKASTTMLAKNQWELIRCLEVLNLLDIGELVFITARERKETRGRHIRPDFPVTNPMLNRLLLVRKVDGKPVIKWEEVKT